VADFEAELVGALRQIAERLRALELRLDDVRSLSARAYERQERWAERLEAIRRSPGYEDAFSGDPLVSVRIATYKGAELLMERSLSSVRRQTYPHWEAVVVGDGTTDDTAERIASLGDDRVRFWNRPVNGPYPDDPVRRWMVAGTHALNEGSEAARGAWLAPLDQDDEWDDDHIEVLLREAQRERAELVYGRLRVAIEGTGIETWLGEWPPRDGHFAFQGAIYHAHLKGFQYDIAAQWVDEGADWNLARRMWEAGVRFAFLPRFVGTYRVSSGPAWWAERARERGQTPAA
jgi:glycosyltransferase involved in cell wall biosynthesis